MKLIPMLLKMSPYLLLFTIMLALSLINIILTYFFRKYKKLTSTKLSSESTIGDFFALLGGIYGLLLGFVVLLVYGSYNDAQAKANQEQSIAKSLYREIRYYPNKQETKPLMNAYINYVHSVIEKEYPQMENLEPFNKKNQVYLNDIYREMEKLISKDSKIEIMINHLNDMAMYRSLRQMDSESAIPFVIWVPLCLGYIILIVCSLFLKIESIRMHLFVNGMLGAFIGLVIFIIMIINHPFSGSLKIEPEDYKIILQMNKEDA